MTVGQFLKATLVVGLIGAVGGALGGAMIGLGLVIAGFFGQSFTFSDTLGNLAGVSVITGAFGAAFGVVLGPLLGWTLMRRVPIGRAIGETAFAAALGVGAAFIVPIIPSAIFAYPVFAALLAALRLRFTHRLKPERTAAPPDQLTPG